jgi:stearoyl-CoA desaturase (Delta-9 desaturase)
MSKDNTAISQVQVTPRITVTSDTFRSAQLIHAVGIVLLPLIGTVYAFYFAFQVRFGIMEVVLFAVLYALSILGITAGYHRLFAHRAYATKPAIRFLFGVFGSIAAQGPVTYWVSNHRRHHRFSDRDGDPHSPHVSGKHTRTGLPGFLHAHMGWTLDPEITNTAVFAKDLLRDQVAARLNRTYYLWVGLGLAVPFAIGGIVTHSWVGAVSGLLWGGFVRLFISYHATNSINSITHLFGSRPFDTPEKSRNNAWLVLPTLGEGLHNNHHAFPTSALFGYRWWHFDIGSWVILLLERLGLAWQVHRPQTSVIAAKLRESSTV